MINRSDQKSFEQAFPAKTNASRDKSHEVEIFSHGETLSTRGRGRGQENRGGRSRGQGFYANFKGKGNDGGKNYEKSQVQCSYCKIFGHDEYNYWKKQKHKANFMNKKEMWSLYFMLMILLIMFPRRYAFWIVVETT